MTIIRYQSIMLFYAQNKKNKQMNLRLFVDR